MAALAALRHRPAAGVAYVVRRVSLMLFAALVSTGVSSQEPFLSDAAAQAALIYQFGKFTTWPSQAAWDRFRICLAGEREALARSLSTLQGKQVHGRVVEFRQLAAREGAEGCQVLFIAEPHPGFAQRLKQVQKLPVLTMGDAPGFIDDGGMIGFVTAEDKLRFDVNTEAIEGQGLELKALVVRMARNYKGRR